MTEKRRSSPKPHIRAVIIAVSILCILPYLTFCQGDWGVQLGQKSYVNIDHLPYSEWIPDGHISVLPDGSGQYMMYWSEFSNSRTVGETQFPEDQKTLQPINDVFGGRVGNEGPSNGYNDGGSWLMSVHRHNGDTLIGFYHGESHWYPRNGDYTAWKSICIAYSYDNGYTWEDKGTIVTSNTPKPETRSWGGAGDCCVVWDSVNRRWNCYHQEHNIRLAVSHDALGAPGTWKKYYNGDFNEEGLGGRSSALSNLSGVGGANPSVHWNTFYKKWAMTYHGWDGGIYITLSNDGLNWEYPNKIISKDIHNRWYPTIIGESDTKAGKLARLYYAEFNSSGRKMAARDILFDTIENNYDHGDLKDPWEAQNVGTFSFPGKAGIRNAIITLTGTTNILFGEYDAFYYMFQQVKENGEISANITSQTVANNMAYSGIMLRTSSASGSDFISLSRKSQTDTLVISYRDSNTQQSETIISKYNWFKIKKEDSTIELLISEDGVSWDSVLSVKLELSKDFLAGLFTTSHNESNFCTATFENTVVDFSVVNIATLKPDAIRINPNPANEKLYITMKDGIDKFSYKLIGIAGRVYMKGSLEAKFSELDISELPTNQYFIVQIFDDNLFVYGDKIFKR